MNQTWKIVLAVIVTTVIVGGGVYYWQNSKTSLEPPVAKETNNLEEELPITEEDKEQPTEYTQEETNEVEEELPIANEPVEQPEVESPTETNESTDEIANWKTYSSTGVTISYPNDGTYTIDEKGIDPSLDGFTISQEHPGNRIHIYKSDSSALSDEAETKVINGKTYKVFHREGMGSGYGYVMERNGQFYTFKSVWGPENEVFELMMTTVEFE